MFSEKKRVRLRRSSKDKLIDIIELYNTRMQKKMQRIDELKQENEDLRARIDAINFARQES